jgi:hypothetical protein
MIAVLGGLADVERDLIRTRTAEGRSRARKAWATHGADPQNSLTRSKPRPDGDGRAVLRLPNSRSATMSARARFRDCDDEASPHQHLAEQIRAMTVDREALEKFFAINRARFDRCLEPQMSCQKKAIRAHSIQNAKTLDLLEKSGHLIAIRARFSENVPQIDFEYVGRNEASTFTGFCSEHDRDIFAPIDRNMLDTTNHEHFFFYLCIVLSHSSFTPLSNVP